MVFKLNEIIAEKLVVRLSVVLDKKVIVADVRGDVLSASALSEISKNYDELRKCAESGRELLILKSYKNGGLPKGLAMPIKFSGEVSGSVFVEDNNQDLEKFKKLLRMSVELLLQQNLMTDSMPYKDKIKDNFVYGYLHRKLNVDDAKTRDEAELFEVNLLRDKVVVVVRPIGFWNSQFKEKPSASEDEKQVVISGFKKNLYIGISEFFGRLSGCSVCYFGSDTFVILVDELYSIDGIEMVGQIKARQDEFSSIIKKQIGPQHMEKLLIGLGSFYKGKDGPILAYEEARRAINLGVHLNQEKSLYHIDDLGMIATLAGGNKKWQTNYVKHVLQHVLVDEYLMETLEGFFKNNMSLTQTSKKLKIHRNTLLYRLDKIKKMSGFDPRLFNDAIELEVALTLNKLLSTDTPQFE